MEEKGRPSLPAGRRAKTTLLTLSVAVALLALGWLLGRHSAPEPGGAATAEPPDPPPSPLATSAPRAVELRLDAGALRLLPDASLHLKPIEPLDPQTLDR
jgi:hypothetical protein